jgi:putative PEP-CTERM system TPR-repeat lipoprotein
LSRHIAQTLLLCATLITAVATYAEDANVSYEKAVQSYEEGEVEESFIHLKNALQADPNLLSARLLLAQIYFNEGDLASAEEESREALLLGADMNLVLPVYGQSLVLQEKVDELFEIERVADTFTTASQIEWALLKGQGHLLRGEQELARREFERAASILPDDVRSNNTVAAIYMNSGMEAEALALVEKSLRLDPQNPKSWQLRGELSFQQKNYTQALEYFRRGNELDPEDPRIQRSLAQVYLHLDNREKTQEYLDLILEESPNDPAATLISALLLIGDGDVELGENMLSNLSGTLARFDEVGKQSDDTMLFIRASAEYIQNNDLNAISLFNAYLAKNTADVTAIRLLADLYLRNGEIRRATELLSSREPAVAGDLGLSVQLLSLYINSGNQYRAHELLENLKRNGAGNNPYVVMLEAELLRSDGQKTDALRVLDAHQFGDEEPLGYGILRGVLQLETGAQADAERTVQQLNERFPDSIRVDNLAAVIFLTADKLPDAQRHVEAALLLDPADIDARFNQAMWHRKRGELDQAQRILKPLLEDQPSNTKALLLLARILYLAGEYDEAIEWSDKVYAYDSTSATASVLQLEIYSQAGNWEMALQVAQRLVREDPQNARYLVQLAEIAVKAKEPELAQNTLSRLYPLWKEDPEKLRELAALQLRFGNKAAARKSLQRALKLDRESYVVELDLARLDLAEGNIDKAQDAALALQKAEPKRAEGSILLGEIALESKRPEEAQRHFMHAFQLDHNNLDAIARLYELGAQGIEQQAFIDAMETSLKESSLPVLAVRLLADTHLTLGNTAQATRYYEKLLDLDELAADPAILNNLANIYAASDLDKALATAQKALEAEGVEQNSALLDTMGWILARKGENEEALSYLRKAYVKNSTDPEIRYHLGATLIALGRTAEGERELRAALDSGKPFNGREDAEQLISTAAE